MGERAHFQNVWGRPKAVQYICLGQHKDGRAYLRRWLCKVSKSVLSGFGPSGFRCEIGGLNESPRLAVFVCVKSQSRTISADLAVQMRSVAARLATHFCERVKECAELHLGCPSEARH